MTGVRYAALVLFPVLVSGVLCVAGNEIEDNISSRDSAYIGSVLSFPDDIVVLEDESPSLNEDDTEVLEAESPLLSEDGC